MNDTNDLRRRCRALRRVAAEYEAADPALMTVEEIMRRYDAADPESRRSAFEGFVRGWQKLVGVVSAGARIADEAMTRLDLIELQPADDVAAALPRRMGPTDLRATTSRTALRRTA